MAKEIKWDHSKSYVYKYNMEDEKSCYLAMVVFNDEKREPKIDSDIKGYYLVIVNVPDFNPVTGDLGKPDNFYTDVKLLVECYRRGEANFNKAIDMMEESAQKSMEMMEEDKKFIKDLAEWNNVTVEEMKEIIEGKAEEKKKEEEIENSLEKLAKENGMSIDELQEILDVEPKEEKKEKKKASKKKKITFDDIAGMDEAKESLLDVIDQLKNPERYKYFDIEPIKSCLLFGLPGTGKTYISNAFANMIDANFVKINMGDIASKYQGQTGNNIKRIFDEARKSDKFTVLFWDEIDAVANRRGAEENSKEKNSTLNVLLTEMSSDDNDNIFMIFATNFIELLDPAFLRSGRCDIKIEIPLPDFETRLQILKLNTRKKPLGEDVTLSDIAEMMEGNNCADVSLLCNQSARCALKKDKMEINQEDFIETLEKMNMKKKKESTKKIGFSL